MGRLAAVFPLCSFFLLLLAEGKKRETASQHEAPMPGAATLASFSPYKDAPEGKALADLAVWAQKAQREAAKTEALLQRLKEKAAAREEGEDEEEPQEEEVDGVEAPQDEGDPQQEQQGEKPLMPQQQPQEEEDLGLAEAVLRNAALAAEFQKLQIERQLIRHDAQTEATANKLYSENIALMEGLSAIPPSLIASSLSSPTGTSLVPFLRPSGPPVVQWSIAGSSFGKFNNLVTLYQIKEKAGGKGYNLNVQQALCIAQTDPEPEAREQAHQAIDAIWKQKEFREQVIKNLRLLLKTREAEEKAKGLKDLPTEENFFGETRVQNAARLAVDGTGCGLYKRVLRIRKHIFLRSKEGLRFGWGDRLALPTTTTAEVGAEYEEAFSVVLGSLSAAAPPLAALLLKWIEEERVEVKIEEKNSQETTECPFEPSPLGVPLQGFGFVSPLTGTLLSYNYTADAGASGLAQFLWRHLMEAKLQEINPLMASFVSLAPEGMSSGSNKSLLSRSNSLLIEAFGLWGKHMAFLEDINSVFNPHQQLRLLLSYLDETIGRVVKGSLRRSFAHKLIQWGNSSKGADDIERMWLRSFKDHFGPEGDVFDTYGGVPSQWLFFDVLEELLQYDSSNTAETRSYFPSSPPKPVHILAFMALNKVANDCYFIKGYSKSGRSRKPTQDVISEAFTSFIADTEKDGFVAALMARGARIESARFWGEAIHEAVDKPILEAEMLAQELSYFLTHKVKGAMGSMGLT